MEKQISELDEQFAKSLLPKLDNKIAMKTFGKGDYDYIYDGGWIGEVICTPDGNYGSWDEYYDSLGNSFDGVDSWGDDGSYSGGNGNSSGQSGTSDYSYGVMAADELGRDISSGNVIALEGKETNTGTAIVNSASLALTMKGVSSSIIDVLKADAGLMTSIGRIAGIAGTGISGVQFIIGATDDEISAQDWCNGANFLLGGAAIVAGFVSAPVLAGILGFGAVIVGVASIVAPGDGESNSGSSY